MKSRFKLFAVAIVVLLLAVVAGSLWPERAETRSVARCPKSDPDISISAPPFIAWGRTGAVRVATGYGPGLVTDTEISFDGGASFRSFEDLGGIIISVTMPRQRSGLHVVLRWQQGAALQDPVAKTCEFTIAGGLGKIGPLRFHEREGGVAVFETVEDPISPDCAKAALFPAALTVSSGSVRRRLSVADQCHPNQAQRSARASNWRLYTNVDGIAFQAWAENPRSRAFRLRFGLARRRSRESSSSRDASIPAAGSGKAPITS